MMIMTPNDFIAKFAEDASTTGRNLERVLNQLKDM